MELHMLPFHLHFFRPFFLLSDLAAAFHTSSAKAGHRAPSDSITQRAVSQNYLPSQHRASSSAILNTHYRLRLFQTRVAHVSSPSPPRDENVDLTAVPLSLQPVRENR